jgi:hypothetical protein
MIGPSQIGMLFTATAAARALVGVVVFRRALVAGTPDGVFSAVGSDAERLAAFCPRGGRMTCTQP